MTRKRKRKMKKSKKMNDDDVIDAVVITKWIIPVLKNIILTYLPLSHHLLLLDGKATLCNRHLSEEDCTSLYVNILRAAENRFGLRSLFTATTYFSRYSSSEYVIRRLTIQWVNRNDKETRLSDDDASFMFVRDIQNKWSRAVQALITVAIQCSCVTFFYYFMQPSITANIIFGSVLFITCHLLFFGFLEVICEDLLINWWQPREGKRFKEISCKIRQWAKTAERDVIPAKEIMQMLGQ